MRLFWATATALALLLQQACLAKRSYIQRLPNVPPDWPAVGHFSPNSNGPINPFGWDFVKEGKQWTVALCEMDSDDDGLTNGEELGDPRCVWHPGEVPERTTDITNPGIPNTRPPSASAPTPPPSNTDSPTKQPTYDDETKAPSFEAFTGSPTRPPSDEENPITRTPTPKPTYDSSTGSPVTRRPTDSANTRVPTRLPTSDGNTVSPATKRPTNAADWGTESPTRLPTSNEIETNAPTTASPTTAMPTRTPTTREPTGTPSEETASPSVPTWQPTTTTEAPTPHESEASSSSPTLKPTSRPTPQATLPGADALPTWLVVHAVVGAVAIGLVLPLGNLVSSYGRKYTAEWKNLHAGLGVVTSILSAISFGVGVYHAWDSFGSRHGQMGLAWIIVCALQGASGSGRYWRITLLRSAWQWHEAKRLVAIPLSVALLWSGYHKLLNEDWFPPFPPVFWLQFAAIHVFVCIVFWLAHSWFHFRKWKTMRDRRLARQWEGITRCTVEGPSSAAPSATASSVVGGRDYSSIESAQSSESSTSGNAPDVENLESYRQPLLGDGTPNNE